MLRLSERYLRLYSFGWPAAQHGLQLRIKFGGKFPLYSSTQGCFSSCLVFGLCNLNPSAHLICRSDGRFTASARTSSTPPIGDQPRSQRHRGKPSSSTNGVMPLCPRYWDFTLQPTKYLTHQHLMYKIRCCQGRVMNEEQRINVCKTSMNQIHTMLRTAPHEWRSYLTLARTIMTHLDSTTFMRQANRSQEQVWMLAGLQRLAFSEADSGGVVDIAAWCSRNWLLVNQREPQNLASLRGIGQAWLSRAQPTLARIHRNEGSSSSAGSQRSQRSNPDGRRQDSREEEVATSADVDAERRAGSADYVEARGFLQPATEYLERAVAAATSHRAVSGDLLATTAEAYMSLGNVSSPRINEGHFGRALQLLQAATEIEGYTLSRYLQQYLDEYARLLA